MEMEPSQPLLEAYIEEEDNEEEEESIVEEDMV